MINNELMCVHCGTRRGLHFGFNLGCPNGSGLKFKAAPDPALAHIDPEHVHRVLKRVEHVLGLANAGHHTMWSRDEILAAMQAIRE